MALIQPERLDAISQANPGVGANEAFINAVYLAKFGRPATRGELDRFLGQTVKDVTGIVLREDSPFQNVGGLKDQLTGGQKELLNRVLEFTPTPRPQEELLQEAETLFGPEFQRLTNELAADVDLRRNRLGEDTDTAIQRVLQERGYLQSSAARNRELFGLGAERTRRGAESALAERQIFTSPLGEKLFGETNRELELNRQGLEEGISRNFGVSQQTESDIRKNLQRGTFDLDKFAEQQQRALDRQKQTALGGFAADPEFRFQNYLSTL
jgi:hypothetical protein